MRTLLLASLVLSGLAGAAPCPVRDTPWPTSEWPRNPVDPVAKAAQLSALESYAFTLTGKDEERLGFRTNSLLIVKHGAVVYERYARGWDENKRHIAWSMAKSITSALTGLAVANGALGLDDSICTHLPGYSGEVCAVRVRDVLTFSSGLQWQEEYEDKGYQVSSVLAMLLGVGHKDVVKHALTHKKVAEPGAQFVYSTGEATVLATVVKNALAAAHGPKAFWSLLFDKLGLQRVVLEEDPQGAPFGGSYLYATPRDYAKLGYLYLNDGCWAGERLLPENWVAESLTPSKAFRTFRADGETTPAGYMWWVNRELPEQGLGKPWPALPEDTFAAQGHWGQRIVVIPSEDLIVVRTGDDRKGNIEINELTRLALEVAR